MNDVTPESSHPHDVLVIGAGGAGLRAAIEAADAGADVGLVCKSLLGKAHTVMAEGGSRRRSRHVADGGQRGRPTSATRWSAASSSTTRGWPSSMPRRRRTASASSRRWGAVFDRTRDGRILQRPFGGHTHPRLAHVGDRTGLEMIRTLQDRAVASGVTVYMECTITHLIDRDRPGHRRVRLLARRRAGRSCSRPRRSSWRPAASVGPARSRSNSWEYSGDGQALAYLAGAELIDMEFVQFHPTGMVWPPGVRGLLVTEAVRGEGGILRNKDGERFMWKYLPDDRRHEYAETDEEAARWVEALTRRQTDRRAAAARAVDPRQRRAGDLHRGPRGPRLAARRRVPRHQLPAGRSRPPQAALDVRAVQGAGRRRHHRAARWRSARRPTT